MVPETADATRLSVDDAELCVQRVDRAEWFGTPRIVSQSNANDRFWVALRPTPRSEAGFLGLVLKGPDYTVRSTGSGSSDGQLDSVSFWVGRELALKLAAGLGVQLQERTHPGYALQTQFRYDAATGEAVCEIHNVGQVPVLFMDGGRNRGERNNQFGFSAFRDANPVPDTGNPTHFGGLAAFVSLKPGETFSKRVKLAKWFELTPGTYTVVGTFYLEFQENQDAHRVLWEDYVAGEFSFAIE